MYIVRDKITKKTIHVNPAPLSQQLVGQDIYYKFDPNTMEIGKTDLGMEPKEFNINAAGEIELTSAEKVTSGLLTIAPDEKFINDRVVKKILSEQVSDGLITLSPFQKIIGLGDDERIVSKSLSEQATDGLITLLPTQRIIGEGENEQIVATPLFEQVKAGYIKLAPNQKLVGEEIVEKTEAELLKQGLITLEEVKQKKIQYFSDRALEKRAALLPDYKLQNALLGIYDEQTVADYKATVQAFRDEFHRLEKLIEKAKTLKKIETIVENFPKEITIAKLA